MKLGRWAAAALAAMASVAGASRPAYAWDELGHRVVARIAWDRMTPRAREAAVRLLMAAPPRTGLTETVAAADPERGRELFIWAAVWPDLIRSRTHPGNAYAHADWHYVNWFWEQSAPGARPVDRPDLPRAGELLNQLPRQAATLADAAAPDSARAVALAWVLHLVGDVHQPLHNSARVSPQDPQGDRGGNSFTFAGLYPRNNLHGYWDAQVGINVPWTAGADPNEAAYVGSIARRIEARYTPAWSRGRLLPGAYEDWSREGFRAAKTSLYPAWLVRGEPIPARYGPWAWNVAEPRIALAGYRLADVLNRALGS